MNIIQSIILEFGPCATPEILDYLRSNFFYQKGHYTPIEWTYSKIKYQLKKISRENNEIFKFKSINGYKIRYGTTKFRYYLLKEPRYLRVKGYIKRCMYCGMPIYIYDSKVFHFKYKCKQYQTQNFFKLLKIDTFWVIISPNFVHGILDDLQSGDLRLPGRNQNKSPKNIYSELWLINEIARERELIESDRLLPLKAEEYIV